MFSTFSVFSEVRSLIVKMLSSFLRNFAHSRWLVPSNFNLRDSLKLGASFTDVRQVTADMTANRQRRHGDEVLSTPAMISMMSVASCDYVDSVLPPKHAGIMKNIKCKRLGNIEIGKNLVLQSTVENISNHSAMIHIKANIEEDGTPIGDAILHVDVVEFE